MPSLILADLGGVVIRIDPSRCHQCWADLSPLPLRDVAERLFPDEKYEALERGELSGQEYLSHVRRELRSDADLATLSACFNDIYLGLDEDVLEVLEEQRTAGVRLAALTNTNQVHHDRWWPMYREALTLFDRIHLSYEVGSRKPEAACFEAVLDAEGVTPDEVVFVDDVEAHVHAARSLGIAGIHFAAAGQLAADLEGLAP